MNKSNLALLIAVLVSQPALAQSTDRATTRAQQSEEQVQPESERRGRSASKWRLYASSGVLYATGDYGTGVRTNSLTVPFAARLTRGPLRLSATIPYRRVTGSPQVIGGDGEAPIIDNPDGITERKTRSGFGDLSLRARYRIAPKAWKGLELDLLGRVKLPTGSERKRLSTGKTDYGIGGELSYTKGRIQPFGEIQYLINGEPPGRDYRNSWRTSVGANTTVARGLNASLSYDYSQSRIRGRRGAHSLDGSLSKRLSQRLTLSGFGSIGLSKRASDFTLGTVLTARVF